MINSSKSVFLFPAGLRVTARFVPYSDGPDGPRRSNHQPQVVRCVVSVVERRFVVTLRRTYTWTGEENAAGLLLAVTSDRTTSLSSTRPARDFWRVARM